MALPNRVILLFSILLFWTACTELSEYDREQVQEVLADSLISSTDSRVVEISFFEEEKLKLIIKADNASTIKEGSNDRTLINGNVRIEIFDDSLNTTTTVQSNRAIYLPRRSEFELFEGVYVETNNDRTLSSEYLKWNRNSGLISSPEFVLIITPTDSITGKGFEGQTDLSEFTIKEGSGVTTVNNK